MSQPKLPPIWRAVLRYSLFDLANLPRRQLLTMMVLPLFMLIPIGIGFSAAGSIEGLARQQVVVVAPDPLDRAEITLWLSHNGSLIDVRATIPADVDTQLSEGTLDLLVLLGPDFEDTAEFQFRKGVHSTGRVPQRIRHQLRDWLSHQWVEDEIGASQAVHLQREDGSAHPADPPQAGPITAFTSGFTAATVRMYIGLFSIGLLGMMGGIRIGSALVKSGREGFNAVLSLGTPRRAIYLSEMLTGTGLYILQGIGWWVVYAVGARLAGTVVGLEVLSTQEVLWDLPMLMALAPMALLQSCLCGCLLHLSTQNLAADTRERLAGLAVTPILLLVIFFGRLISADMVSMAAALPVIGPVALWAHHVDHGAHLIPLVALHLVYSAISVELGARLFLLDESPLTWWQRRQAA